MKTVIICTHGLIKDAPHDFDEFKKYIDENYNDYEVRLLMLYDISDKRTYKYKRMASLLDATIADYESRGYRIILVGYSFSCGLCAKMTKKHSIDRLVIVSPTLHILTQSGIRYYINMFFKAVRMRMKASVNKKRKQSLKKKNSFYLVNLLFSCFYVLHRTRRSFRLIHQPLMLMFGEKDEITKPKYLCDILKDAERSPFVDMRYYKGANHTFIMSRSIDKSRYYSDIVAFSSGIPVS